MGLGINRDGRSNASFNPYEIFQDAIFDRTGVSCSCFVAPTFVSIRAASYAEYLQAKSVVKGMTSLEIRYDFIGKKD